MAWLLANYPIVIAIASGVISEVIAIRQALKYPANDGFGGILSGILKALGMIPTIAAPKV